MSTHGTLPDYKIRGCRCTPCTQAVRAYDNRRTRLLAYGQWEPYVDAAPVRAHLQMLADSGLGYKQTATVAGLAPSAVAKIIYGAAYRGMGPTKRVRPATAAALLAITPDLDAMADGALVDATAARRRLQALVATGWSQSRLAERLGMHRANFTGTIRAARVRAATARAVRALYDDLWDTPPPEGTHPQRVAASRARNYAAAAGWPPPLAWDDDTIADPDARPDTGSRSRRSTAVAEDARELRAQGYPDHAIAARLGITESGLRQTLYREPALTP